jgi:predicted Zn-dependent protease
MKKLAAVKRLFSAATSIGVAVMLVACQTIHTTDPGAVKVKRDQRVLSFVTEEQMQEGAAQAYDEELGKARKAGKLNQDATLVTRVRNISKRLIAETPVFRKDAIKWPWEVNVISTEERNAYAMPGGKIMVYSGLVTGLKLTDAELSAVIGHEMAHALREHSRERVSRAYGQQLALTVGAAALGLGDNSLRLADAIGQVTFQLPHSREQEAEADRIGMELMARAGYDPHAAIAVWNKMSAAGGGAPPEFLSTHPSDKSRIKDLQNQLKKVEPVYQPRAN